MMTFYIAMIAGFFIGLVAGQGLIFVLLKDMPKEEILNNKKIKIHYGLLNWAIAFLGAYIATLFM